ncbi:hypothetical protein EDB81DRAFT_376314 [Dactylonectria macrodidyma]|uniref:C2H2-type domain-containing protein n=1 Tax=Dactylonectria macrodidyma TaxID=307937 RepID=A0A9P9JCX0_9HYPO|nr:hypothetical protein EDB81DRAFT_376314 [Dactylonectria macrodidyma]
MAPQDSEAPDRRPRRHVCRVCHKTFVRAEHLRRHIASHENLRHHSCQSCGASFTRADVLHRHLKKCDDHLSRHSRPSPQDQDAQDESRPLLSKRPSLAARTTPTSPVDSNIMAATMEEDMSSHPPADAVPYTQAQISTPPTSLTSPVGVDGTAETDPAPNNAISRVPLHPQVPDQSAQDGLSASSQAGNDPVRNNTVHNNAVQPEPIFVSQPLVSLGTFSASELLPPVLGSWDSTGLDYTNQRFSVVSNHAGIFDDIPDLNMGDFAFLDDNLLLGTGAYQLGLDPIAKSMGSHQPHQPQQQQQQQHRPQSLQPGLESDEILSSRTRHTSPTVEHSNSPDGPVEYNRPLDYQVSVRPYRALRCTQEEAEVVSRAFLAAGGSEGIPKVNHLSRSRLARLLNAYFEFFDRHTPIIHRPSFSISLAHPGLILAMSAIGGCYLSEHDLACQAYEACCRIIAQYETELLHTADYSIWPIQATLLCAQFGAFGSNMQHFRQAQRHITLVSDLLAAAETKPRASTQKPISDWHHWVQRETLSRLTCWAWILNGVIICYDARTTGNFVRQEPSELHLPSSDSLWRASSAPEWAIAREMEHPPSTSMNDAVKMILHAQAPPEPISSFGLMALLGSILSSILSVEQSTLFSSGIMDKDSVSKMEQALHVWEILWRRHPHAETVPSRHGDSLMVDSLSLLGSAYYHLYLGPELRYLKRNASNPDTRSSRPQYRAHPRVLRAVEYAASSWLIRAKLGIAHLQRLAAIMFGGHVLATAYEGALILSWWLSTREEAACHFSADAENRERLRRLDGLFSEIFEEISDQGIDCDAQEVHPGSPPLAFYGMLMHRSVWTYACVLHQYLENAEVRLQAERPSTAGAIAIG